MPESSIRGLRRAYKRWRCPGDNGSGSHPADSAPAPSPPFPSHSAAATCTPSSDHTTGLAAAEANTMAHVAEQLKDRGNQHFKNGDYVNAEALYTQAIQRNPNNPLLFTNRANARMKLEAYLEVIDDCIKSIELLRENMKAYTFLGTCLRLR